MELGVRLREARHQAGMSQKQLCDGIVTRNMLSQIENGVARPSMDTLTRLARRLGKPVGWFLGEPEEENPILPFRETFARGDYAGLVEALGHRAHLDQELALLLCLSCLALGEQALKDGRPGLTRHRLEQAAQWESFAYCPEYLRYRRLLLLGNLEPEAWASLPDPDGTLLAKAHGLLATGEAERAACLLDAVQTRGTDWALLRGRCALAMEQWEAAAGFLHQAETDFPRQTAPLLERAYREQGDFRRAYEYACRQRIE